MENYFSKIKSTPFKQLHLWLYPEFLDKEIAISPSLNISMRIDQPDYGLDAPKLVYKLLIGGPLLIVLGILLALSFTGWISILGGISFVFGFICLGVGLLMVWSSYYGKTNTCNQMLDMVQLKGNETVLDAGCGQGLLLIGLAKRLTNGRAIGVDRWSQKDLSHNYPSVTLKNAVVEGVKDRIEINDGDMQEMPFVNARFDVAVSSLSIHNINSTYGRRRAIREIVRVLKPGGHVALMDIRNTNEYVNGLKEEGMKDVRVSRPFFGIFPPVRIITAYKDKG